MFHNFPFTFKVLMEERQEEKRKGASPFRVRTSETGGESPLVTYMFNIQGYAERVKAKVIREYVDGSKNRKRWGRDREGEGDGGDGGGEGVGREGGREKGGGRPRSRGDGWRPPTRALPVRKQSRRLLKTRSQVNQRKRTTKKLTFYRPEPLDGQVVRGGEKGKSIPPCQVEAHVLQVN